MAPTTAKIKGAPTTHETRSKYNLIGLANDGTERGYTCPARWFDQAHREILAQSPYAPTRDEAREESQRLRDLTAATIGWSLGVAMMTLAVWRGWIGS